VIALLQRARLVSVALTEVDVRQLHFNCLDRHLCCWDSSSTSGWQTYREVLDEEIFNLTFQPATLLMQPAQHYD
jgi:hypothetical protein